MGLFLLLLLLEIQASGLQDSEINGKGRRRGTLPVPCFAVHVGVSENRGPYYSTLNSLNNRILIIRTPKTRYLNFRKPPCPEAAYDLACPGASLSYRLLAWAPLAELNLKASTVSLIFA